MSSEASVTTFVSHTNKPGGGELALRRYLEVTSLPVRLVTAVPGGVWRGLDIEVRHAPHLPRLRAELSHGGVIVANSMRAAFSTALVAPRRARLVYWVRDGLVRSAMSRRALTLTRQVTARRVDHYFANSEWTAATIRAALGGLPGRVDVVTSMCGVSADDLRRQAPRQPHQPVRLLYLGRIARWKAPDVAVKALALLRENGVDARLTLAGAALFGERRYAKHLAALVAAEPHARLVGHVGDVGGLLAVHDLVVHTSRRPEPFGQVVVQALAAGLPVLATRDGGPGEILGGAPYDLTYAGGDPRELADGVVRALACYADLAGWAQHRAADYLDDTLASRTDAALRAVREPPW